MAYIVGDITEEEEKTLKERGWDVEPAPNWFIETGPECEKHLRLRMVFVDSDMFAIMSGPDWEK